MNKETALQNQIIAELNRRGHFAQNHTVGTFLAPGDGRRVKIGNHGEADIWGFRKGDARALFLEIKMPGERPRQDQYAFLEAVRKMGAISGWCTSVEEAVRIVEEA